MNPANEPADSRTFEQALAELEATVRALEAGDTALEESLAKYEAGVGLLKRCYAQLRHAEQRILLLAGEDADGRPTAQPFEHTSTAEPDRANGRRQLRKRDPME